jgi:hypothetical protein
MDRDTLHAKYVLILELSRSVFRFEIAQTVWKLQTPNAIAAIFIHNLIRPIRRIYVKTYGTVAPLSIFLYINENVRNRTRNPYLNANTVW